MTTIGDGVVALTDTQIEDKFRRVIAERDVARREVARLNEALIRARNKRHCGCAWCCARTDPEKRGEVHQRTCSAP